MTVQCSTLEDKIKKLDASFVDIWKKKTRKEDDALCHWREYFENKKEGEG